MKQHTIGKHVILTYKNETRKNDLIWQTLQLTLQNISEWERKFYDTQHSCDCQWQHLLSHFFSFYKKLERRKTLFNTRSSLEINKLDRFRIFLLIWANVSNSIILMCHKISRLERFRKQMFYWGNIWNSIVLMSHESVSLIVLEKNKRCFLFGWVFLVQ